MIASQYIVICLKDFTQEDPCTYVQTTRKRFSKEGAEHYMKAIAPSRKPIAVPVPYVRLDKKNNPISS